MIKWKESVIQIKNMDIAEFCVTSEIEVGEYKFEASRLVTVNSA